MGEWLPIGNHMATTVDTRGEAYSRTSISEAIALLDVDETAGNKARILLLFHLASHFRCAKVRLLSEKPMKGAHYLTYFGLSGEKNVDALLQKNAKKFGYSEILAYLCTRNAEKHCRPRWWNGRHEGLKIPWPGMVVRVRVPLAAPAWWCVKIRFASDGKPNKTRKNQIKPLFL